MRRWKSEVVTLPLLFSKEFSAVTAALQLNSEATVALLKEIMRSRCAAVSRESL